MGQYPVWDLKKRLTGMLCGKFPEEYQACNNPSVMWAIIDAFSCVSTRSLNGFQNLFLKYVSWQGAHWVLWANFPTVLLDTKLLQVFLCTLFQFSPFTLFCAPITEKQANAASGRIAKKRKARGPSLCVQHLYILSLLGQFSVPISPRLKCLTVQSCSAPSYPSITQTFPTNPDDFGRRARTV